MFKLELSLIVLTRHVIGSALIVAIGRFAPVLTNQVAVCRKANHCRRRSSIFSAGVSGDILPAPRRLGFTRFFGRIARLEPLHSNNHCQIMNSSRVAMATVKKVSFDHQIRSILMSTADSSAESRSFPPDTSLFYHTVSRRTWRLTTYLHVLCCENNRCSVSNPKHSDFSAFLPSKLAKPLQCCYHVNFVA